MVLHTFCFMSQNVLVDGLTLAQSTIAQMAVQKMHVIVQKKQVAFVDNGPQHQTGRGADVGAAQTHKATQGSCHSMTTGGEYCDNPLRLTNEIDAALAEHGLAKDRHLITSSIKFNDPKPNWLYRTTPRPKCVLRDNWDSGDCDSMSRLRRGT